MSVEDPQVTTSETMLAFHAPPLAVIPPVTHDEKITKKSERRFGIADGFLEGST